MNRLLAKEIRLAAHPTNFLFLALSAMLIIPNYPYYVTFFYTSLGLFFLCLLGRENRDIEYTMTLPVKKRDVVKSRFLFSILIELAQVLLAIPFAVIRQKINPVGNLVGLDANIAFFGSALLMMGLSNFAFFVSYYSAPDKIGIAFLKSSAVMTVYMVAAETLTHVVPLVRDRIDTPDPAYLPLKLAVLAFGIAAFALFTFAAYRASARRFEKLDL